MAKVVLTIECEDEREAQEVLQWSEVRLAVLDYLNELRDWYKYGKSPTWIKDIPTTTDIAFQASIGLREALQSRNIDIDF